MSICCLLELQVRCTIHSSWIIYSELLWGFQYCCWQFLLWALWHFGGSIHSTGRTKELQSTRYLETWSKSCTMCGCFTTGTHNFWRRLATWRWGTWGPAALLAMWQQILRMWSTCWRPTSRITQKDRKPATIWMTCWGEGSLALTVSFGKCNGKLQSVNLQQDHCATSCSKLCKWNLTHGSCRCCRKVAVQEWLWICKTFWVGSHLILFANLRLDLIQNTFISRFPLWSLLTRLTLPQNSPPIASSPTLSFGKPSGLSMSVGKESCDMLFIKSTSLPCLWSTKGSNKWWCSSLRTLQKI